MPGILKIHSTFAREWLPGHSWLEYSPLDGIPRTYSTWGNNPTNQGNGLFENLELGKDSDACRSVIIDNVQELRLFQRIDHYRHMGNKAWTLLAPCSTFAADVWHHVTGESLKFRTGLISNPSTLARSIIEANGTGLKQKAGNRPASHQSPDAPEHIKTIYAGRKNRSSKKRTYGRR